MSDYRSHDFKVGHCECFVQAWDAALKAAGPHTDHTQDAPEAQ